MNHVQHGQTSISTEPLSWPNPLVRNIKDYVQLGRIHEYMLYFLQIIKVYIYSEMEENIFKIEKKQDGIVISGNKKLLKEQKIRIYL